MTADLCIHIFTYNSSHARTLHELVQRAFSNVPSHSRPKDTQEYLNYMQGPANPAGPAVVATARIDGECIGNISATPFQFMTRSGQSLTAFQLGSVVVDARHQRQGVGSKLVAAITEHLAAIPDSFTYIYPNKRSEPVLRRADYTAARDIPTYVHFPSLRSFGGIANGSQVSDRRLGGWQIALTDLAGVMAMADDWPGTPNKQAGFARNPDFFAWRFGGPGANTRYRFVICHAKTGNDTFAFVLANHFFNGIRLTVFIDLLSRNPFAQFGLALKAAQVVGGAAGERFVYANSNIPRLALGTADISARPWGVAVPNAVNPRPGRLMYFTRERSTLTDEIDASIAMTSDWMGF